MSIDVRTDAGLFMRVKFSFDVAGKPRPADPA